MAESPKFTLFQLNYFKNQKDAADSFRILVKKQEFNKEDHKNLVKTNTKSRWKGDQIMKDPEFYHELQILCMSPAVAFQDFQEAHSVLLASGTMSPLDTFESELGVPFQHKVEADHVVKSDQVFCRYITKAKNEHQLNSTFRNRDNKSYLEGLGELVVDVTQEVKSGGILVFFSSYSEMNSKLSVWKDMQIYQKLSNLATIFDEKSISGKIFDSKIVEFKEKCKSQRCVLFAVCRGKISEGIDFADSAARVVMAIGPVRG